MTTPSASSESPHRAAPTTSASANGKASAVPPKVTGGNAVDKMMLPEDKPPLHEDIMQLARLGEIGPVQSLFETGKFNATYKDHEGITPLHVSQEMIFVTTRHGLRLLGGSGLRSTTTMRFANSFLSPAQRSTQKAASPLLHLRCGLHNDAIST